MVGRLGGYGAIGRIRNHPREGEGRRRRPRGGDGRATYNATFKTMSFEGKKMTAAYDFPPDEQAEVVLVAAFEGDSASGTWVLRAKQDKTEVASGTWKVKKK